MSYYDGGDSVKMIITDQQKLRERSVEIDKSDRQVMTFLQQKLEKEADRVGEALGLSAPQIGNRKRAFIVANPNRDDPSVYGCGVLVRQPRWLFFVNPRILEYDDGEQSNVEGCLSIPGVKVLVKRAKQILIADDFNVYEKYVVAGLDAMVWQHELDHLDGILIIDRGTVVQ